MIRYRWSTREELPELLDLIADGFSWRGATIDPQEGFEHRILFEYLYSRPSWRPELVWIGEAEGRLITAVGFFPQQLSLGGAYTTVWAVSPVVTRSDCRGRGLAGQCLTTALEMVKNQGVTAVFLWGIPAFYPKFGFVPVFSRYKTKLAKTQWIKRTLNPEGRFRPVTAADVSNIAALYDSRRAELWLQPVRSLEWWQSRVAEMDCDRAEFREVPFPRKGNFLIWENNSAEVAGYLYFEAERDQNRTVIIESGATDYLNALAMVQAFAADFWETGQLLWIRGTAQHFLNMAAYRLGGTHLAPAPWAGMIKILDWPGFLAQYFKAGRSNSAILNNNVTLSIPFQDESGLYQLVMNPEGYALTPGLGNGEGLSAYQMTRLVMGVYDWDELGVLKKLKQDPEPFFPLRAPFIWDANYLY